MNFGTKSRSPSASRANNIYATIRAPPKEVYISSAKLWQGTIAPNIILLKFMLRHNTTRKYRTIVFSGIEWRKQNDPLAPGLRRCGVLIVGHH
eukprot:4943458-Pyramimonas_sp.AAC.1